MSNTNISVNTKNGDKVLTPSESIAVMIMGSAPSAICIIGSFIVFILAIFGSVKTSSVAITFLILLVISCVLFQIEAYLWF